MRLGKYGKLMHLDRVALGKGYVDRFTFFEFKPIGGVILNIFNTVEQDRFHTHAFDAISVMLRGEYLEEIQDEAGTRTRLRKSDITFLPRELNHRLMRSTPNAVSITFMGPWKSTWTEWFPGGKRRTLSWGRQASRAA